LVYEIRSGVRSDMEGDEVELEMRTECEKLKQRGMEGFK